MVALIFFHLLYGIVGSFVLICLGPPLRKRGYHHVVYSKSRLGAVLPDRSRQHLIAKANKPNRE
ncbi:MAG: hypothetical protein H7237_01115 [Alkalinema sp. FL-bin-369]|nr:hypothetical protein [Leptolyngbyaceae cyanobacterium LF-bin-369]